MIKVILAVMMKMITTVIKNKNNDYKNDNDFADDEE